MVGRDCVIYVDPDFILGLIGDELTCDPPQVEKGVKVKLCTLCWFYGDLGLSTPATRAMMQKTKREAHGQG